LDLFAAVMRRAPEWTQGPIGPPAALSLAAMAEVSAPVSHCPPATVQAVFGDGSSPAGARSWSGTFVAPHRVLRADVLDEVPRVVQEADTAARAGAWVVLVLAYEAAPAFDAACVVRAGSLPWLAWSAVFEAPVATQGEAVVVKPPAPDMAGATRPRVSEWCASLDAAAFARCANAVLGSIAAGDTYQVNLTFPLHATLEGEPYAWYRESQRRARVPHAAYIDTGELVIASLSPELFFERRGSRVTTRPMKGTAPRGRWRGEDEAARDRLVQSEKARAENVMIVDLLRNDLGRIARTGSVRVDDLFHAELYPTVWQLTSTVSADVSAAMPLREVLTALFPCGSVTGAPKVRTMQVIAAHEPDPRGVYTGAIGLLRPGGDATFSVPIRTVLIDRASRRVTLGVGAGITADSQPDEEYAECLLKGRFAHGDDPARAAGLFETLRLEDRAFWLRDRHLTRLADSADLLDVPFDPAAASAALDGVAAAHPAGCWRVRLCLSADGEVTTSVDRHVDASVSWRVAWAAHPVDASDRRLFHKTQDRTMYDAARAPRPDVDDVLLWNGDGYVTESTVGNIVVEHEGQRVTPPVEAGLLPGTFRAELLARGEIREKMLTRRDVERAPHVWIVNSLRGWIDANLVDPG
jgi:para-aminobenzoate synthetase / 4-amino-4-deoxychorismate lyase